MLGHNAFFDEENECPVLAQMNKAFDSATYIRRIAMEKNFLLPFARIETSFRFHPK